MSERERSLAIVARLREAYPDVSGTALTNRNPLELLVATILSAQCTDAQVNAVTGPLFAKYRTAHDYAEADLEELQALIRSTGFYRNKAAFIKASAKQLIEEFDAKVPRSLDALTTLHGVARKTANVVLAHAFGIVEGIAVDTHVMRLSTRLGFTEVKDRDKIERDLMELFPTDQWLMLSDLLMAHGRTVCGARRPKCGVCVVNRLCPSAFTFD